MPPEATRSILFLHGFTGCKEDWDATMAFLSREGFSCQATDILGHGNSFPQSVTTQMYSMQHIAHTLMADVPSRFHLVGYSMGGRLALYIATHFPSIVQSLTLVSASPGLKTAEERRARRLSDSTLADQIEANGIAWFVDYWENLPLWNSQSLELKAQLREKRLRNNPRGLANSLRGMGTGAMPSLWTHLGNLAMPVQLIVGELDSKFVAINREMREYIPEARLQIIPSTGHAAHLEQPEQFNQLLLEFLQTRVPS